jgi:hypothetical protein
MIPKKIKMSVMTNNNDGTFSFSGDKEYVPYPLTGLKVDRRFSMNTKTGVGSYSDTGFFQNKKEGEIVFFENSTTPYYAIMNNINYEWHASSEIYFINGELKFLFFKEDYWELVEESFVEMYHNKEITSEEFYQEMFKIFNIDDALEICSEEVIKFLNK